jgi:serine/threonine protein kinase
MPSPESSASKSESAAYAPGDVILGKYTLESLLGEGGMGSVWRARNTALDAPVAIKLIRADLNRETLGIRLLQEARAAAKLGHPAIVRVFDVGQTEKGDPFIVMELLEGQSFGSLLAAGRMPPAQAVRMLLPIADALSRAHAKGIVHRDLKPDNVFLVADEERVQPKLVDFGIVKVEQRDGGSQLTQVGTVLGSPEYMSPEQARGQDDVDHRTDVWSFAVMLYEATTGRLPFAAANYNALMRLIVESKPPTPLELAAADARLSAIIEQGMAKDREQRFRSMGEFGRALAYWLVDQGVPEDICGVSLESKWLGRSSDPAQGRASMLSSPDMTWPPPYSGVRTTPRPSPGAQTAPAVVQGSSSLAPKRDRTWLWVALAVAAALIATLGFLLTRPERAEPQVLPPTAAEVPPIVAAEPEKAPPKPEPVAPAAAQLAPPEPASSAIERPDQGAPKKPKMVNRPGAAAPATNKARPKKAGPADDLLSPY